jgi:hypothetical protein
MIDAIHSHVDKMISDGIMADDNAKKQNAAEALCMIANAYLNQMDSEKAEAIIAENSHNDYDLADQMSFLLNVIEGFVAGSNPLTGLTADVDISESEDLLGKVVGDLQENVSVSSDNVISGSLFYLDDYTGFSSIPEEQHGHYIAIHFSVPDESGVTIKVKVNEEVTLDSDGIIVLIVNENSLNKKVRVTASKEGYNDITKTYSLKGLKLLLDD